MSEWLKNESDHFMRKIDSERRRNATFGVFAEPYLQCVVDHAIQARTDAQGGEVTSENLWKVFADEYLPAEDPEHRWGRFRLESINVDSQEGGATKLKVLLNVDGRRFEKTATGSGPIDAMQSVFHSEGIDIRLLDYSEHTLSSNSNARAASYIEAAVGSRVLWGIGIDSSTTWASLKALTSAVNRALRDSK